MDFDELIDQAELLPAGPKKIELLELAVQYAEAANDELRAYGVRRWLVDTAQSAGMLERAIAAFVMCLKQTDSNPDFEDEQIDILWAYIGITMFAADDPAYALERIDDMLDDLEDRFRRLSLGTRPVEHLRWRMLMRTGRLKEAQKIWQTWKMGQTTELCYDLASQVDSSVELLFRCRRYEDALKEAYPITHEGLESPGPVPEITYCYVMICHLRLGQMKQADEYHKKGIRLLDENQISLFEISYHLVYLVHTRKLERALGHFERRLHWAVNTTDLDNICLFYNATGALFQILADERDSIRLTLPRGFEGFRSDNEYATRELAELMSNVASDIALRFDRRNGNSDYSEWISGLRELCLRGPGQPNG